MRSHQKVFALIAILIASIGAAPAFAQMQDPITVTTDKPAYNDGETIIVSGEVRELLSGYPITLQVFAANGNLVTVEQIDVGADKSYRTELTAGGVLWKSKGTYTVKVLYGTESRVAEATFEFSGSGVMQPGNRIKVQGTDFSVSYTIVGGRVLSIIPDVDAKSLIIEIEATSDGQLTITLPRALIDAKIGDADDEFFVLVEGEEVDFDETKTDTDRTLTISFHAGDTEIEIIGTFVIPEFGAIAALVLAVAIISIIVVTAKTRLGVIPKY